jgi:hypothetical protein
MHMSRWIPAPLPAARRKSRRAFRFLSLPACFLLLLHLGCLFHRKGPEAATPRPAPARIALLPVNVPHDAPDLRWLSFTTAAMMAQVVLSSPDLEAVPLWESVPVALQSLGNSRTVTLDLAELVATRLTARWATQADLFMDNKTPRLRIDFIPADTNLVPFRYEKPAPTNLLEERLREAFEQFLRYLNGGPLPRRESQEMDAAAMKEVGAALDEEYGWFVPAKPGAAARLVESLSKSAPAVAKVLFSPTLYPVLGPIKPPAP